jgi:hypothetical protein
MAINIQSLFADIIDTPEQRQQKLLQQGMVQGQLLSSGLRGRAAALAPLAQVAGQLGVQRQEDLRRAVQPMIGIDPRTTGEKLAEQLGQIDTSTPEGLMQAAQAIQSVDPVRAAALRQASVEATRAEEERDLRMKGERQRQELALAADKRSEEALALETGSFIDRMTTASMQRNQIALTIERLQGTIEDEETRRELEGEAREAIKNLETNLADTYAENPATKELSEFIRSGAMSTQGLEALITPAPTEWSFDTQQFIGKDGNPVNMRVAIDTKNPSNIVVMNPSKDQPEPTELPEVPKITATEIKDQYLPVIDNSPVLKNLTEGESRFIGKDDPATITAEELADMMHTLRYGRQIPLPQVTTIVTQLARENPDALARGIIPQQYINLAQQSIGSGGNPPLNPAEQNRGTAAEPQPLSDDVLSRYPDLRILPSRGSAASTQGLMPTPPAQESLPNPFNVGINSAPPAATDMRLGSPAIGYDEAFTRQIQMEEERVREGIVSPYRLNIVKRNFSRQLEKRQEQLKNELRYLKGLKSYAAPNKEERISSVQSQLKDVEQKLNRYKVSD